MPPFRPNCPDELAAVLDFIWEALDEHALKHDEVWEPDDPSPVCVVGCVDADGVANIGYVGWNAATDTLTFLGHREEVERRDVKEGVAADESLCWINCRTADLFLTFIVGDMRRVVAKVQRIQIQLDAEQQT